jgi:hypothetical protein
MRAKCSNCGQQLRAATAGSNCGQQLRAATAGSDCHVSCRADAIGPAKPVCVNAASGFVLERHLDTHAVGVDLAILDRDIHLGDFTDPQITQVLTGPLDRMGGCVCP